MSDPTNVDTSAFTRVAGEARAAGPSRIAAPAPAKAVTVNSLADRIRKGKRSTLTFTLQYTLEEPLVIECIRPGLPYLMSMGLVPHHIRDLVNDLIRDRQGGELKLDAYVEKYGIEVVEKFMDLVDATCIAGFVNPRLVLKPEDVEDPETQLSVKEIHPEDRSAFFHWAQQEVAAEAAIVKSDPRAESPSDAVDDGPEGEPVRLHPDVSGPDGVELAERSDSV